METNSREIPRLATLTILFVVILALAALPGLVRAQSPSWFSVTVRPSQYVILNDAAFYYINMSLAQGLRSSYWYVNVSTPQFINVVRPGTTELPSPLISLSAPNSTSVNLPGVLSSAQWQALLVHSSNYTATLLLRPQNLTLTEPFSMAVYLTSSAYEPYLTYYMVITNNGSAPAYVTIAYGIGSADLNGGKWFVNAEIPDSNGTYSIVALSNATKVQGARAVTAIEYLGNEPLLAIGVQPLNATYYVEELRGRLFGLSYNSTFIIATFETPLLQPGQSYVVEFRAYAAWPSPLNMASVDALSALLYDDPSVLSNLTGELMYSSVKSQLLANVNNLSATIKSLEEQVNNLSAKLYYYSVQVSTLSKSNSYYAKIAHRGGLVAGGLFVVGVVIGLLGGAYFLSPSARETLAKSRQGVQSKKGRK